MGADFSDLAKKWPSAWVARTKISEFTGGLVSERYLAHLDARGKGPAGKVKIGRKIAYPVEEVVKWLERRADETTTTERTKK